MLYIANIQSVRYYSANTNYLWAHYKYLFYYTYIGVFLLFDYYPVSVLDIYAPLWCRALWKTNTHQGVSA